MCLAIPSRIVEINNDMGIIDVEGVRREVSLLLIEAPVVDDYVIVHAGFAIKKIDEAEALESLNVLREIAAKMSGEEDKP
jgi:hydrogenase expression/formation protein HypC